MNSTDLSSFSFAKAISVGRTWMVVVFGALLLLGVLANLKVFIGVLALSKKKRKRPASILVAHLSCVATCLAVLSGVLVVERADLLNLKGNGICEAVSFIKNAIFGSFSLSVTAIIYERFQLFNCFNRGKLLTFRLIVLIWTISLLTNIPSYFMVTYTEQEVYDPNGNRTMESKCKSVHLFGSLKNTIITEVLRFLIFHKLVVVYMVYALYKIRASLKKLSILKPSPDKKTLRKVQNVRFLYIHFFIFVFVWLPFGILTGVERVISRMPIVKTLNTKSPLRDVLGLFLCSYLVLFPLIYMWLISCKKQCRVTHQKQGSDVENQTTKEKANESHVHGKNKDGGINLEMERVQAYYKPAPVVEYTSMELSRMSTYAFSANDVSTTD